MPANTKSLKWNQPDDINISVWRYMDLWKFESILKKSSLRLTRPDGFKDPLEGTLSLNHSFPGPVKINDSGTEISIEEAVEYAKRWSYVNCWHMNECENREMWKEYTKTNESIAIKTTYGNLADCLPGSVELGMVKYFDFDGRWAPPFGTISFVLACKEKSFIYEQEARLIMAYKLPFHEDGSPDLEKANEFTGLDLEETVIFSV